MYLAEGVRYASKLCCNGCRNVAPVHMRVDKVDSLVAHPTRQCQQSVRIKTTTKGYNRYRDASLLKLVSQGTAFTNAGYINTKRWIVKSWEHSYEPTFNPTIGQPRDYTCDMICFLGILVHPSHSNYGGRV